jgi:excinuclease ABC subunit A
MRALEDDIQLDKRRNHTIEVVVDRLVLKTGVEQRLEASVETATKLANGLVLVLLSGEGPDEEKLFSQKQACPNCGASVPCYRAAIVFVQQPVWSL